MATTDAAVAGKIQPRLKAKYKDMKVLPLSIYMDDLVDEVRKALLGLSGERKEEGFTSRMDTDAHYRDEASKRFDGRLVRSSSYRAHTHNA